MCNTCAMCTSDHRHVCVIRVLCALQIIDMYVQGSLYLTGNESDYVIRHTHERDRPILGSVKIDKAKYTSYT